MNQVLKKHSDMKTPCNRRSLRRINKLMQKNLSQYKIPNPYKTYRSQTCLPLGLCKQLAKLDYLSVRSLQNLHYKLPSLNEQLKDLLVKMRLAVRKQSQEFDSYMHLMEEKFKRTQSDCLRTEHQLRIVVEEQIQKDKKEGEFSRLQIRDDEINYDSHVENNNDNSQLHHAAQLEGGASMMSDNYQMDKFALPHFVHPALQMEEHLDSYDI